MSKQIPSLETIFYPKWSAGSPIYYSVGSTATPEQLAAVKRSIVQLEQATKLVFRSLSDVASYTGTFVGFDFVTTGDSSADLSTKKIIINGTVVDLEGTILHELGHILSLRLAGNNR
jgi:hypothetical protein